MRQAVRLSFGGDGKTWLICANGNGVHAFFWGERIDELNIVGTLRS